MCRRFRAAITLMELLVVVGILGVLMAMLLPGIAATRETARMVHCKNNLKQLALAVISHNNHRDRMPKFWDDGVLRQVYTMNRDRDGRRQGETVEVTHLGSSGIKGNWFVQVLPYVDEAMLYDYIASANSKSYRQVLVDPGYPAVPASPDYKPGRAERPADPNHEKESNCPKRQVFDEVPPNDVEENVGYDYEFPNPPPRYHWEPPSCPKIPDPLPYLPPIAGQGTAGKPGKPPTYRLEYMGLDAIADKVFNVLLCPSDPSTSNSYTAKWPSPWPYETIKAGRPWSVSNYQPNWHAFSSVSGDATPEEMPANPLDYDPDAYRSRALAAKFYSPGSDCPPSALEKLTDGVSNTILFGEAYAFCNRANRLALWGQSDWRHDQSRNAQSLPTSSFGLSWTQWEAGQKDHEYLPYGRSGAENNLTPANTWMFQSRPRLDRCIPVRIQAMHYGGLNVALADGAVRTINPDISHQEVSDPEAVAIKGGGKFVEPVDMRAGKVDENGNRMPAPGYGVWDKLLIPRDGEPIDF